MMIVKKKRELGLISFLNSKTVRYKQMQSSARLKNRYKGRFVANGYDWYVCNKSILNTIHFTGSDIEPIWIVSNR